MDGPRTCEPLETAGPDLPVDVAEASVIQVLDGVEGMFRAGFVGRGMAYLTPTLSVLRRRCSAQGWKALSQSTLRSHPLHEFLQQDPFTGHSFLKPRGYSGDAGLLDLIYNPDSPPSDATGTGRAVWQYSINVPEPTAVRERKAILSREIEAVCHRVANPRVFSVACGHLREGAGSEGLMAGQFRREGAAFLALDQDQRSLAVVDAAYGHLGVKTLPLSVRALLARKMPGRDFDLIYAAGLYDYLSSPLAARLTAELFRLLRPGGKLLVANFTTGNFSIGYMETYMDWHLIYRDDFEVEAFLDEIESGDIQARRTYRGGNGHIAYLEALKAA